MLDLILKVCSSLNNSSASLPLGFIENYQIFSEQLRENDRQLRKVNRDVERDRTKLEREEKKIEADIKKAAKAGNKGLNWINLSLPFLENINFQLNSYEENYS